MNKEIVEARKEGKKRTPIVRIKETEQEKHRNDFLVWEQSDFLLLHFQKRATSEIQSSKATSLPFAFISDTIDVQKKKQC